MLSKREPHNLIVRTILSIVSILTLWGCSRPDWHALIQSGIRNAYAAGTQPMSPTSDTQRWLMAAKKGLGEVETNADHCALLYYIAFKSPDGEDSVLQFAKHMSKYVGTPNYGKWSEIEKFPNCLEALAIEKRSVLATKYLIAMWLDGGPGSTQQEIVLKLAINHPGLVGKALKELEQGKLEDARLSFSAADQGLRFLFNDIHGEDLRNLAARLQKSTIEEEKYFGRWLKKLGQFRHDK